MTTDTAGDASDTSPKTRGRFIAIEGIDGTGKSTLARMLADTLHQQGIEVVSTREPGGSPLAEQLRTLILQHEDLDPETELLLIFAARRDHIRYTIRPALERGHWVICDRFTGSSQDDDRAGGRWDSRIRSARRGTPRIGTCLTKLQTRVFQHMRHVRPSRANYVSSSPSARW